MDNPFKGNNDGNNNNFGLFVNSFDQNSMKNDNVSMNGGQAKVLKKKAANNNNDPFMDLLSFN